jgi:hypothetical protein
MNLNERLVRQRRKCVLAVGNERRRIANRYHQSGLQNIRCENVFMNTRRHRESAPGAVLGGEHAFADGECLLWREEARQIRLQPLYGVAAHEHRLAPVRHAIAIAIVNQPNTRRIDSSAQRT